MNPALNRFDDATLIAELEARTLRALGHEVDYASDIDVSRFVDWQQHARIGSRRLQTAIENAGLRP